MQIQLLAESSPDAAPVRAGSALAASAPRPAPSLFNPL